LFVVMRVLKGFVLDIQYSLEQRFISFSLNP
jgi:hypothetical protein